MACRVGVHFAGGQKEFLAAQVLAGDILVGDATRESSVLAGLRFHHSSENSGKLHARAIS